MKQPARVPSSSRSWRHIRQEVNPRAMSREGRKRARLSALRFTALGVFVLGCAWAGFEMHRAWENHSRIFKAPVKAVPLKGVELVTDGTLDHAWLDATLALPPGACLSELDLPALLARLLASGQVRSAVLTPRFSRQILVVTLRERTPVVRLRLAAGEVLLAARDGVVYRGVGYPFTQLEGLPWLDGVTLKRAGPAGYEPIPDMEPVDSLLASARSVFPDLYDGWRVVSLARCASDREIIVRSGEISRIVFNARADFLPQLAQLDYIVDTMRRQSAAGMASVNFAAGSQVAVDLAASEPGGPALRPSASSKFFQPRL